MFSTYASLAKRTGRDGVGRFSYLNQLVSEYNDSPNEDYKLQVLANLANFAYDPINYEYFRSLGVLDIFIECLRSHDCSGPYVQYAMAAICNCCLDKDIKEQLLAAGMGQLAINCLSTTDEETVLSTLTTLMFLVTPVSKPDIVCPPVIEAVSRLSKSTNIRVANLANVFLQDYCQPDQIQEALSLMNDNEPTSSS